MRKTRSSGFVRQLLNSRVLIVAELTVVAIFSVAVTKEIVRRWEINREITRLHEQIELAKGKSTELSGLIDYFQSDYYKEKEARLKLGLQKEGEQAITIPGLAEESGVISNAAVYPDPSVNVETASIPKKWWNYFFNKTN